MCEKLSPEGDSPDRWSRLTDKLESVEKALTAASAEIKQLRNLLISTYHTLGAHRMLSSAETWNDVADQLRTEIGKTIFPKEDYIKKIH